MFKLKVATNEDNYKEVVLKRAIILCWILLFICFVIKIFGGNFFNIVCNNERFVKLCEFIDNTIFYYIIGYISFIITTLMLYFIIIKTSSKYKTILFVIFSSIYWIFKLLYELKLINIPSIIYMFSDYIILYLLLIIFSKKYLKSLFAIILMVIFTLISVFIKNIGLANQITTYMLVATIFMIDYYIMLTLKLLYSRLNYLKNKKGGLIMGIFGWGYWLKEEIEKYKVLRDATKNENEIKIYNEIIADLENKAKKEK